MFQIFDITKAFRYIIPDLINVTILKYPVTFPSDFRIHLSVHELDCMIKQEKEMYAYNLHVPAHVYSQYQCECIYTDQPDMQC